MKIYKKGEFVSLSYNLSFHYYKVISSYELFGEQRYDLQRCGSNQLDNGIDLLECKMNKEETIRINRNLKLEQLGI